MNYKDRDRKHARIREFLRQCGKDNDRRVDRGFFGSAWDGLQIMIRGMPQCSHCNKICDSHKELVPLKICWDPKKIRTYKRIGGYISYGKGKAHDLDFTHLAIDDAFEIDTSIMLGEGKYTWVSKARGTYYEYEEDKTCCSIRLKCNWPSEYAVPHEFIRECDNYYGKKVCNDCAKKIYNDLIQSAESLLEQLKICCPRCNVRFLPHELSLPTLFEPHEKKPLKSVYEEYMEEIILLKDVYEESIEELDEPYCPAPPTPTLRKLPRYWVIESFADKEVCKGCRNDIFEFEYERFISAKAKCSDVAVHSANYKGNIRINPSNIKKGVVSGNYRNKVDARNELKLRAFLEGFNVVFNCTLNEHPASYGNYQYTEWSARGNFAKKRV